MRFLLRLSLAALLPSFLLPAALPAAETCADHTTTGSFEAIPDSFFALARDSLRIFYGHTSHGSQILTGISMLASEDPSHAGPLFSEVWSDLGHNGDLAWVPVTRDFLDAHPDYNMVIWSWCAGVSDNTEEGIDAYLNAMDTLEADYPGVFFVYMTGHLDGTGPSGNLYIRNNQIRSFCATNEKILFDFADIESYDPDGTWYPDESDACAWCSDWCAVHSCPTCDNCAHSHCFNCYRKGKAFWWMAARLLGWQETTGTEEGAPVLPSASLRSRPNPFNPPAEITFRLAHPAEIRVDLFDTRGRLVASLAAGHAAAGQHHLVWDGTDAGGRPLPSGSYLALLRAGPLAEATRLTLIR